MAMLRAEKWQKVSMAISNIDAADQPVLFSNSSAPTTSALLILNLTLRLMATNSGPDPLSKSVGKMTQ